MRWKYICLCFLVGALSFASLLLFIHVQAGYSASQHAATNGGWIGEWLTNAGFHHIQTSLLRRAPSSGLVVGTKGK